MNATQRLNIAGKIGPVVHCEELPGGNLVLKQLKWDGSKFALQAYVSPGVSIEPIIYKIGTLDECRKAYRAAKADLAKMA